MLFHRFSCDALAQSCYLLADGDEALIVDPLRDADDVLAPPHVFRQEVAHAARRFCAWHIYSLGSVSPCCFWYFPFLSAYDTSQTSSLWKNST